MSFPTVYYITQVIPSCYSAGYAMCVCVSFGACVYRSLGRTPFYGRPLHQKESPLDRTHFEHDNWPPVDAGSILADTRRTTATWPSTSPLQRHNQRIYQKDNDHVAVHVSATKTQSTHLPEGQRPRGRPRLRCKDIIKRNLKKRIFIPTRIHLWYYSYMYG